ncbi:hypothetical protein [Kribbella sp. NPDC051620]|uniref:hypothetical protein n=1 Tax=Kribbella sp. NPDC051620 TaxID=3364120 RepID=UPI0037B2833C
MSNGSVIAAVLGYNNVEEIKADQDNAAFRLAYLLDYPARTSASLLVFAKILYLVSEEADVPSVRDIPALVEETSRIAGRAAPLDEPLRLAAARGFGVDDNPDSVAAIYGVCDRAVRFLFKAITIARGETDQPPSDV